MSLCLVCGTEISPFISFGRMPIANGFLSKDEFDREYFYNLAVGFCEQCSMVQLTERVDPPRMFNDHYHFYSSTSSAMAEHFREFAEAMGRRHLKGPDPFVVEIGCNDGILLQHFARKGIRHLGVEPSSNVAQAARDKGLRVISRFFDEALAREIVREFGPADAVLAANVMCHIPDLHSVLEGIRLLLKPGGVLVFEDPYVGEILAKTAFDQIYDEHVYYFSLASLDFLFRRHALEIVNVEPQKVHGGSMRYTVVRRGTGSVDTSVQRLREIEANRGLDRVEEYRKFSNRVETRRERLRNLLLDMKARKKRVVGYGATSKSTTVINYCGITPDLVEFISDTTPVKQGKFSPGMHIPIRPYTEFQRNFPDYALLFAWNHAEEIMAKEEAFMAQGGKWIVYIPEVRVF